MIKPKHLEKGDTVAIVSLSTTLSCGSLRTTAACAANAASIAANNVNFLIFVFPFTSSLRFKSLRFKSLRFKSLRFKSPLRGFKYLKAEGRFKGLCPT